MSRTGAGREQSVCLRQWSRLNDIWRDQVRQREFEQNLPPIFLVPRLFAGVIDGGEFQKGREDEKVAGTEVNVHGLKRKVSSISWNGFAYFVYDLTCRRFRGGTSSIWTTYCQGILVKSFLESFLSITYSSSVA